MKKGEPVTWLTCHDYTTAYLQEQAGIEMILVGDSLGMTMLGFDSTLPVKMDDMIRHAQAVRRGAPLLHANGRGDPYGNARRAAKSDGHHNAATADCGLHTNYTGAAYVHLHGDIHACAANRYSGPDADIHADSD